MKSIAIYKRVSGCLLVFVLAFIGGCKKSDEKGCGWGGVIIPNTYLFWMNRDFGCGPITVQMRDRNGAVVQAYQEKTSVYESVPPSCNNGTYANHATFDLSPGYTYTYRASCSGKVWTGTINVPCEQSKCFTIQLQ